MLHVLVHSIDVRDPLVVLLIGMGVSVAIAMLLEVQRSRLERTLRLAPSFPVALACCVVILGAGGVVGMLITFRGNTEQGLSVGFAFAILVEIISVVLLFARQRRS